MFFLNFGFRKLSSATRIAKNQRNLEENTKEETKDSQECLGPGLSSEALLFGFWVFFLFLVLFVVFVLVGFGSPVQRKQTYCPPNLAPHEIVFDCFCLGFVLCLLYPYPKKTGSLRDRV